MLAAVTPRPPATPYEPLRSLPLTWPLDRMAQVAVELVTCDNLMICSARDLSSRFEERFGYRLSPAQAGCMARVIGIRTVKTQRVVFRIAAFVTGLATSGEIPAPVARRRYPSDIRSEQRRTS